MKSLVSILCITYNQEKFIGQALDSFLMQKTDFGFEVLINDDASTDGTVEIIKEYQRKYPDIIKPNFQKENQYSKGNMGLFVEFLFPKVTGKYIALCEGDDYWIDDNKLQSQVDFLENNPDYAMCFNRSRVIFQNKEEKNALFPAITEDEVFTLKRLLKENYIQTNSVMYRTQNYEGIRTDVMPQDWYMHLYHAQFGKIGFIDRVMSVYRRHEGGIWWDSRKHMDEIYKKHSIRLIALYEELLRLFGSNKTYASLIYEHLRYLFRGFIEIDRSAKLHLMADTNKTYPGVVNFYVQQQTKQLDEAVREINRTQVLDQKHDAVSRELKQKNAQLQAVLGSKTHKLAEVLAYPARVIRSLFVRK
jgi:glycosyltransferase involved in cell wall biosynthesis